MATRHGDRAKQREKVTGEWSAEKGEEREMQTKHCRPSAEQLMSSS